MRASIFVLSSILLALTEGLQLQPKWKRADVNTAAIGPEKVLQRTGYIPVNRTIGTPAEIFYWMFESRSQPSTDPLILWLTGGPGCAGEIALFYENGPYHLDKNLNPQLNVYSWNTNANIIFLDQPVGTGFSSSLYGDYDSTEAQISQHLHTFLLGFFAKFPQYSKLPLYVTGESYAGHYVPEFARFILQENLAGKPKINLQGIAIGNGWFDPYYGFNSYYEFVTSLNFTLSLTQKAKLKAASLPCLAALTKISSNTAACDVYTNYAITVLSGAEGYRVNHYDVTQSCKVPPLCYDFSAIETYMNTGRVQQAIGARWVRWQLCDRTVYSALAADRMTNSTNALEYVLNQGVKTLLYAGEYDFTCNHFGIDEMLKSLRWPGKKEYNNAKYATWNVDGQDGGSTKVVRNLQFIKVAKSGHLVPMDQPARALSMIQKFISQ